MQAKYRSGDGVEVNTLKDEQKGKCCGISRKACIIISVIVVIVIVAAVIGIIVYFTAYHNKGTTGDDTVTESPLLPPSQAAGVRVDCLVDQLVKTVEACKERKCGWDPDAVDDGDKCSLISSDDIGYTISEETIDGAVTTLELSWSGKKTSLFSKPEDIIERITVEIEQLNEHMLRITFLDADDLNRYRVPLPLNIPSTNTKSRQYSVSLSKIGAKFYVKVTRKSDKTIIFDTSVADLVMEKQYLSVSTKTPSKNVFGFGENLHKSFKHQFKKAETWAMFARDQPPGQDSTQHYDNLYGVHPFFVCIENSGAAHGVFLLNSNAQDVTLTPGPMVTYRTIGGILDFFLFTGPTPNNVVQQYTGLIGRPYMPPYWSLGFQLCRYGYKNTGEIRAAVDRTLNASIPLDIQYADIDYMDARKDFTIDPVNFGGLADYFKDLRANYSMKTIIILDPALSIQNGYSIYPEGKQKDIYIKWPSDGSSAICDACADEQNNMFGYVWPDNKTVFPDFFKSSTKQIWKDWIVKQRAELEFDGLWIDMNEPANFDTNKDRPWNWDTQRPGEPFWNLKCDMSNHLERPPYKTKACHIYAGELRNISDKTLCMVAVQGQNGEYTHYDVHNLYGWSQTEPTLVALRAAVGNNKRGMVISRSTFPGSGQYAGHWLGDNSANWEHLRESIIGMLEFNLFGIPYVGADICGFFGNTTAQLCKRWMQLGAFYPFARNHNGINYIDHDPGVFEDRTVAELSRTSLETRYRLLPYLYTLFYAANTRGDTVVSSLQFEWPTDAQVMNIDEQFLWGDAILFSPILYKDQINVRAYLPEGKWYDYYDHTVASENGKEYINIAVNGTSEIPIHIRGGRVIPTKQSAQTTTDSRRTAFKLLVALDENESASGELFWDDGQTIGQLFCCDGEDLYSVDLRIECFTYNTSSTHCLIQFTSQDQFVNSTVEQGSCTQGADGSVSLTIDMIYILGTNGNATSVTIDDADVQFKKNDHVLIVENLSQSITSQFSLQWK